MKSQVHFILCDVIFLRVFLGCRGNLKLIILGSERVNGVHGILKESPEPLSNNFGSSV